MMIFTLRSTLNRFLFITHSHQSVQNCAHISRHHRIESVHSDSSIEFVFTLLDVSHMSNTNARLPFTIPTASYQSANGNTCVLKRRRVSYDMYAKSQFIAPLLQLMVLLHRPRQSVIITQTARDDPIGRVV